MKFTIKSIAAFVAVIALISTFVLIFESKPTPAECKPQPLRQMPC